MTKQLIIAGFHRSGTSLTAQLFHKAGLFLGYSLLGAKASNPYGHFEDEEIMLFHDRLLRDHQLTWQVNRLFIPVVSKSRWTAMRSIVDRRNVDHQLWGFKDPRVCLFLGLWKYLLPDAKILIVYRHFSDSCYSLSQRHATELFEESGPSSIHQRFWKEPDLALSMWIAHNQALLAFARRFPADVFVLSHEILKEGLPIVAMVKDKWKLALDNVETFEVYDPAVTRSRKDRQPVCNPAVARKALHVWKELQKMSQRMQRLQ